MNWKKYKKLFPEKLKKARLDAGLTQVELGARIGLSGQSIWAEEAAHSTGKKRQGMRKSNIIKIFRILPELERDFQENFQ